MKKVRSFGSFDDLRVPDIDGYSNEETGSYNSDSDSFSGGGYVQDVSPVRQDPPGGVGRQVRGGSVPLRRHRV